MIEVLLYMIIPIQADVDFISNGILVADNDNLAQDSHEVLTENGLVRGFVMDNTDIIQYFDIPYGRFNAKMPFQKPDKPVAWDTVLSNEKHVSRCPQIDQNDAYIGRVDCLTLSVFKRTGVENTDVLFHIHDGDFNSGSGDPGVYSPLQIVQEGIILVLPNYRLGPLGFMCWQNDTVPGNAGLKDLALALEWVKNNIKSFGGNASNIVVSGSDSAGALVDYLVIANQTSKYIAKAITESGFALSHWALDRDPLRTAKGMINADGDLESIIRAGKNFTFKPCIEKKGGFVTDSFWGLLQTHKINIPLMIGSANQAGMEHVLNLDRESILEINRDLSLLLPDDLVFQGNQQNEISKRVKRQYFGEKNITRKVLDRLSLCFTDFAYISPGIRQARLMTQAGGTVYFYEFSYTGDRQHPIPGASNGDSLHYVFTTSSSPVELLNTSIKYEGRDHDKLTITLNPIKTLWITFIKTGIPTALNVKWNVFGSNAGKEECLIIGCEIKLTDNLHAERLRLWNEIYDRHYVEINLSSTLKSCIYITIITFSIVLNTF